MTSTLTRRKPLRSRARKLRRKRDPERLEWIAGQECCVCRAHGKRQWTKTEVAHIYNVTVNGGGAYSKRPDDSRTLPMCRQHHSRGMPWSYHNLGKRFGDYHGVDLEQLIEEHTERFGIEIGRTMA